MVVYPDAFHPSLFHPALPLFSGSLEGRTQYIEGGEAKIASFLRSGFRKRAKPTLEPIPARETTNLFDLVITPLPQETENVQVICWSMCT